MHEPPGGLAHLSFNYRVVVPVASGETSHPEGELVYRVSRNVRAESPAKGEWLNAVTFRRSMNARMGGFEHVWVRAEPVGVVNLPRRVSDRRCHGLRLG